MKAASVTVLASALTLCLAAVSVRTAERATVVLCAEMLGGMSEAFELTLEYLKTRDQFGVKIGTFQGLQHRAAELFAELELARSIVLQALMAIDSGEGDLALLIKLKSIFPSK